MEKQNLLERLNSLVENSKNFQKIMQDGIIEESEIMEQTALVERLIGNIEKNLSAEDFKAVTELLAEIAVLQTITQFKNIQ